MEDLKETQLQEVEALESIYDSEVNVVCRDYPSICLEVITSIETSSYDQLNGITLKTTLPAQYPNVPPEIELLGPEEDELWEEIQGTVYDELVKIANENVGMPMIFTLVSGLQDAITNELENRKENAEKIEAKKKEIADRLEQVHFEGSRVTVEQFNEWRDKFMKEIRARKEAEARKKELAASRLTGKQLFLRDASLNVSDLQIMNATDSSAGVDIDASLFEDDIDDGEESSDDDDDDNT